MQHIRQQIQVTLWWFVYHVQSIWHIRHLLTTELALTLACSLILSRLDYTATLCCTELQPTVSTRRSCSECRTLRRVVLQSARRSPSQPLLQQLHSLPVRQRIDYKLAVLTLTYKIHRTSTPVYLSRHIQPRTVTPRLRCSATPRVCKPTTRTNFTDHACCCSATAV